MDLEIGQVLWLKVRYSTDSNNIVDKPHPMLVVVIDIEGENIEVIAIDKAKDRIYRLYSEANRFIDSDNPKEDVINMDSYAQLDNKLTIEYFPEIIQFRKTTSKLSKEKLEDLIRDYNEYHRDNVILPQKVVHMSKSEILKLNS